MSDAAVTVILIPGAERRLSPSLPGSPWRNPSALLGTRPHTGARVAGSSGLFQSKLRLPPAASALLPLPVASRLSHRRWLPSRLSVPLCSGSAEDLVEAQSLRYLALRGGRPGLSLPMSPQHPHTERRNPGGFAKVVSHS